MLGSSLEGASLFNKVAVAAREPAQPENDWHRRAASRAGVDDGKFHRAAEHRACVLVPVPGADARSGFRGEGWNEAKSVL